MFFNANDWSVVNDHGELFLLHSSLSGKIYDYFCLFYFLEFHRATFLSAKVNDLKSAGALLKKPMK